MCIIQQALNFIMQGCARKVSNIYWMWNQWADIVHFTYARLSCKAESLSIYFTLTVFMLGLIVALYGDPLDCINCAILFVDMTHSYLGQKLMSMPRCVFLILESDALYADTVEVWSRLCKNCLAIFMTAHLCVVKIHYDVRYVLIRILSWSCRSV